MIFNKFILKKNCGFKFLIVSALVVSILVSILLTGILTTFINMYIIDNEALSTYTLTGLKEYEDGTHNIYSILEDTELPEIKDFVCFLADENTGGIIFEKKYDFFVYRQLYEEEPVLGRFFTEEELEKGEKVAVVSKQAIRSKLYKSDGTLYKVGEKFNIRGTEYEIIGIYDSVVYNTKGYNFPKDLDYIIPARSTVQNIMGSVAAEIQFFRPLSASENKTLLSYTNYGYGRITSNGQMIRNSQKIVYIEYGGYVLVILILCAVNAVILFRYLAVENIKKYTVMKACGAKNTDIFFRIYGNSMAYVVISFVIALILYPATAPLRDYFYIDSEFTLKGAALLLAGYIAVISICLAKPARDLASRPIVDRRLWK